MAIALQPPDTLMATESENLPISVHWRTIRQEDTGNGAKGNTKLGVGRYIGPSVIFTVGQG